jgi:DNA-binding PadR family transcriptional regulator
MYILRYKDDYLMNMHWMRERVFFNQRRHHREGGRDHREECQEPGSGASGPADERGRGYWHGHGNGRGHGHGHDRGHDHGHGHGGHGHNHGRWHLAGRGRHGGGSGWSRDFGDFGDTGGDGGGQGWMRGRKFGADDLQLMLLGFLEKAPAHGYELIKSLASLSGGFYSPSPGMVYPALTYLEELGYTTVELDGSKKRYHLAGPGREYLDSQRERVVQLFARLEHIARKMEWFKQRAEEMRRSQASAHRGGPTAQEDAATPAEEATPAHWLPELAGARAELKQALLRRHAAAPGEQRRIAAILRKAVAQIEEVAPE